MSQLLDALEEQTASQWFATIHVSEHSFGNVPKGSPRSFKLHTQNGVKIPAIDIFIKYLDERYSDYCLASRGIRMPAKFMNNTKLLDLAGQPWRVPVDTSEYLACHYGESWQTPNPNWSLQDLDNTKIFEV